MTTAQPLVCAPQGDFSNLPLRVSYGTQTLPFDSDNSTFLDSVKGRHKIVTHVQGPYITRKCSTDTGDYYFTIIILGELDPNNSNKSNPPYPFCSSILNLSCGPRFLCRFLFPGHLLNSSTPLSSQAPSFFTFHFEFFPSSYCFSLQVSMQLPLQ